jgi:hypothetical protein
MRKNLTQWVVGCFVFIAAENFAFCLQNAVFLLHAFGRFIMLACRKKTKKKNPVRPMHWAVAGLIY